MEIKTMQEDMPGRWRWYHAAGFHAGVQALSFGLGKLAQRSQGASSPKLGESIVGNTANTLAAWNRDEYHDVGPLVAAAPGWAKAQRGPLV